MSSTAQSVTAVNWWMLPPAVGNMTAGALVGSTTSSSTSFATEGDLEPVPSMLDCFEFAQSYDRTCSWPYSTLQGFQHLCQELKESSDTILQWSNLATIHAHGLLADCSDGKVQVSDAGISVQTFRTLYDIVQDADGTACEAGTAHAAHLERTTMPG